MRMRNKNNTAKKRCYSLEDIAAYNITKDKGLIPYTHKNMIRTISGGILIAYGIGTIWLPTGSILAIVLGAGLLGYDTKPLFNRMKYELNLIKVRYL